MQLCHQCGAANSALSSRCHSCSCSLTQTTEHHRELETGRFDEFAAQAEAYQAGKISRWELGQWVRVTRELMNERREEYVEVVREGELEDVDTEGVQSLECLDHLEYQREAYFDQREQEVSTAIEGIFQIEAAMVKMLEFAHDESLGDTVLVEALHQMWEGNLMVNRAIQMNREFRESLTREDQETHRHR